MVTPSPRSNAIRRNLRSARDALIEECDTSKPIRLVDLSESTDGLRLSRDETETHIVLLQNRTAEVEKYDTEWQHLIDDFQDHDEHASETQVYESLAHGTNGHLTALRKGKDELGLMELKLTRIKESLNDAALHSLNRRGQPVSTDGFAARVKLPNLHLPKFDGDAMLFRHFWKRFESRVDKREGLTDDDKICFLDECLSGKGRIPILGLSLVGENYATTVDLLKQQFQLKPELIIIRLLRTLKQLRCASAKLDDVQATYFEASKIVRQLSEAGETIDQNRSLAMDVLVAFGPAKWVIREVGMRLQFAAMVRNSEPDTVADDNSVGGVMESLAACSVTEILHTIQAFLNDRSTIDDLTDSLNTMPERKSGKHSQPQYGGRPNGPQFMKSTMIPDNYPVGSTFTSQTTKGDRPQKQSADTSIQKPLPPCVFCGEGHFHRNCERYRTYNERLERLKAINACIRCLRSNHETQQCQISPKCWNCHRLGHRSALCPNSSQDNHTASMLAQEADGKSDNGSKKKPKSSTKPSTSNMKQEDRKSGLIAMMNSEECSILSSAIVTVQNPTTGDKVIARLIFDSASSSSYITEDIATRLKLTRSSPFQRTIATFANEESTKTQFTKSNVEILLKDGKAAEICVDIIPFITKSAVTPVTLPPQITQFIESMPYALADNYKTTGPPDILLGNDYFLQFITGIPQTVYQNVSYLPTKVGIVLGGSFSCIDTDQSASNATLLTIHERPAYDLSARHYDDRHWKQAECIERFWRLESIGIADDPTDDDDDIAASHFQQTVKFVDNRWEVGWPYNQEIKLLPSNFGQAYGRFVALARRLQNTSTSIGTEYANVIQTQLDKGIIEAVGSKEDDPPKHPVHYLSHHPVIRMDHLTTKLRVVFDASAKASRNSVALNETMYRGPIHLPDLVGLILRFRLQRIAIIADVEKAFLQISIRPEDRDVTRFLWFKNPEKPNPQQYRIMRFRRVLFGVISSPSLLAQSIQHHLKIAGTDVAKLIADHMYVDNCIVSLDNVNQAKGFYREAKSLFEQCSMNLREWMSNSNDLLATIDEKDRCDSRCAKLLGLRWNSETDNLSLSGDWAKFELCQTKRQVVQALASVFDPLGLYQPVILKLKLFLREMWQSKHAWDETLPTEKQRHWQQLHANVLPIFHHSFNRQNFESIEPNTGSIIVFADASADAFAACVYLRASSSFDRRQCSLVFAKSRVAPKQERKGKGKTLTKELLSLPKLELLAVTMATQLAQFVRSALQLPNTSIITVFTDSTCVLGWIRTNKKLPVFIQNRLKKIRELANAEYRHVSSEDNAADVCSRGTDGLAVINSELWWHGPPWLLQPRSTWPLTPDVPPVTVEDISNTKQSVKESPLHSFPVVEGPSEDSVLGHTIEYAPFDINFEKFSSFGKLVRVSTICLRFLKTLWSSLDLSIRNQKPKLTSLMEAFQGTNETAVSDTEVVTKLWYRGLQKMHYEDVLAALKSKRNLPSIAKQLDLFIDDESLLRCGGRLSKMEMPPDAIHPILLPPKNHVTRLIVRQIHHRCFHTGASHTLNQLRLQFWIPKGRLVVRNVIRGCVTCRKLKGAAFALPKMPNLPYERVARSFPFQFTGVDYLGPVNVRHVDDVKRKHWIIIFTCFTTRAVHLETVPDCTAQAFVNAISRFIARRGVPEKMLSDNAPQFKLTKTLFDRTWKTVFLDQNVTSYMTNHRIDWRFIVELAPWQGGVYERLIAIVKSLFRAEVGRKLLQSDEFDTLVAEIEGIVNSRPITYVNTDVDSGVALRPVDFLSTLATGLPDIDPLVTPSSGEANKFLYRMWKAKQHRLDVLWKRWHEDYLLSLREQHTRYHRHQRNSQRFVPSVNDVVLVRNDDLPRGSWKLGKVTQLLPGSDREIRAAELMLPNRQRIRRTLNHLVPLEIPSVGKSSRDDPTSKQSSTDVEQRQSKDDSEDAFEGFDKREVDSAEQLIRRMRVEDSPSIVDGTQANILFSLALPSLNRQ